MQTKTEFDFKNQADKEIFYNLGKKIYALKDELRFLNRLQSSFNEQNPKQLKNIGISKKICSENSIEITEYLNKLKLKTTISDVFCSVTLEENFENFETKLFNEIKNNYRVLYGFLIFGLTIEEFSCFFQENLRYINKDELSHEHINNIIKNNIPSFKEVFNFVLLSFKSIQLSDISKDKITSYLEEFCDNFQTKEKKVDLEKHWYLIKDEMEYSMFYEDKQFVKKRSEIDKSRIIVDESWVLSIVRKLDGVHQEHAFLILEGKQDNKSLIFFIDLVGNPILPGLGDGKIRVCPYEGGLMDEDLVFQCDRKMMDIRKGDRISSTSWNISKELAKTFVETVIKEKEMPPKFNILGNRSILAGGTGFSSSVSTGHNCFTWAKEKIRNLNDPNIAIIEDDLTSYIFSRTSQLLVNPQQKLTLWYQKPISIIAMVGTAAAVGYLIHKNEEKISNSCAIQ